jgi:hypothetical protein
MSRQRDAMLAIAGLVSRIFRDERRHMRQRSDARYVYHATVTLGTWSAEKGFVPTCPAWTLDLSYQGVGLLTGREFAVGERLRMRFADESREEHIVGATVVLATEVLPGTYRVGMIFEFENADITTQATAGGDIMHG